MSHDYEPSEDTPPHAMHTDPPCAVCGAPKKDHRREPRPLHRPRNDGDGPEALKRLLRF